MTPSPDLRARVMAAARRERAPTRREVGWRNAVLLVSAVVVPALLFFALARARDVPSGLVLEAVSGDSIVALVSLIVSMSRGRSMLGRTSESLLAVVVLTPAALLAWKALISSRFPAAVEWPGEAGFACLRLGCLLGAWPLAALMLARRGTDFVHPRLTGAAIGAVAGAEIWVLVDLACPVAQGPHLLVGHLAPLLLSIAAGFCLGRGVIGLPRS